MSASGAIVVGVDGSAAAERALRWAITEAELRHAPLQLVYGFVPLAGWEDAGLPVLREAYIEFERAGRALLNDAAAKIPAGVRVSTEMPRESPVPVLLRKSASARMIVLGSSGSGGFPGMFIGSTAVAVASHARCPVAVVRGEERDGPVVAGVDGSQASHQAIAQAFDEASWRNVPLVAVHAYGEQLGRLPGPRRAGVEEENVVLAESLAGWAEKYPDVTVERVTVAGKPRQELLRWSETAQLVVVGSRGRGGFRGLLLGSTSEALIQHARCPVMVVRPASA